MQVWHPEDQSDVPARPLPQHLGHRALGGQLMSEAVRGGLHLQLEGPHIILAHVVAVHPDADGTLVSEKDPSAIPENLAMAL